jgi:hypothetical protein
MGKLTIPDKCHGKEERERERESEEVKAERRTR